MLTYFQFLLLSLDEKQLYLSDNGIFLMSHINEKGTIVLYAASDFFVELCINRQQHCVTEIVAFKSLSRLQQHAEHIDLAQLINA